MALRGSREKNLEKTGLLEDHSEDVEASDVSSHKDDTQVTLLELSRLSQEIDDALNYSIKDTAYVETVDVICDLDGDDKEELILTETSRQETEAIPMQQIEQTKPGVEGKISPRLPDESRPLDQFDSKDNGSIDDEPADLKSSLTKAETNEAGEQEQVLEKDDGGVAYETDDHKVLNGESGQDISNAEDTPTVHALPSEAPITEPLLGDASPQIDETEKSGTSASVTDGKDEKKKTKGGLTVSAQRPSNLLIPEKRKQNKGKRKEKKEKVFSITSPSNLPPCSPLSDKSGKKVKAINVAVFVKDGSNKLLMLERGKLTTGGEIKKMMMDNLTLPLTSSPVFAIWLTSPYLELQLKDHHVPFMLRKQWPDLLRKFTVVTDNDIIENDEPVLVFQRNAFLSVLAEKRVTDERVIKLLFEEAKHNILKGKYPVPNCDAEMLGGIIARIEHGKYDPECHKIGYFRKSLSTYLPPTCRSGWFTRSVSVEQKLMDQFAKASERVDDPKKLHRLFLEYCWTLPFYGCTFFKGKVEQQSKINEYWPWKSGVVTVYMGINRQGITIFKENRREILMTLAYDDLSWDYVQSKEENIPDSFCIEFDSLSDDGWKVAKQLQIISPQSVMMDAMVDSCVNEMNRLKIPKSPTSPAEGDSSKPLADEGPPFLKRDRKTNFSLSNPFRFTSH